MNKIIFVILWFQIIILAILWGYLYKIVENQNQIQKDVSFIKNQLWIDEINIKCK